MPGEPLSGLTNDQTVAIPDEHLEQLMRLFQTMEARGLYFDPGPENTTYHTDKGFTIGNYWLFEEMQRFLSYNGDPMESNKAEVMAADFIFFSNRSDKRVEERYIGAYEKIFGKAAADELRSKILQERE